MLSMHLARRGLTAEHGSELVFAMPDGGVLDYRNFRYRIWLPATARAKVAGLSEADRAAADALEDRLLFTLPRDQRGIASA
jgi:hypothetical protein